ncbi:MAG: metal ABC transporter solute-binding protein, Zn/Mn family, partial [Kiloniellaceae bacterium]
MSWLTMHFCGGATRRQRGAAIRAARALVLLVSAGLGGVAGPSLAAMAAPPRVVVDIKPVHALVAGVMEGIAAPRLLIAGAASPHDYALRPSHARALAAADLVVWVGPTLTPSLEKPLAALAGGARRLTLLDDPSMMARDRAGAIDPHIWLDPAKAIKIVAAVARALIALDPANGARYRANEAALAARLRALDQELAKLALFAGRGGKITTEMVRDVTGGWRTKTIWELVDAAAEGD